MKRIMGVIPSEKDVRDYRLKAFSANYPPTYECDTTQVKDQGQVGSCAAHAAAEILESHYGKTLSTDFIYGNAYNLYGTPGPGMKLRDVCKIVKNYGDCDWTLCPTNTEVDKVYSIADKAMKEWLYSANQHTISSYVSLKSMNEIKHAIMNYGPVLAAVMWYTDNKVEKGVLKKGTFLEGGHAIMLYGWSEQGWLLQNSWGSRWGNKGKCILPYSYPIEECYAFIFKQVELKKPFKLLDWLAKLVNKFFAIFAK